MDPRTLLSRLRSIFKSLYLIYLAGILALILSYSLLFVAIQHDFHIPGGNVDFITAIYFVIMTMTTTGYGDIYPITLLGRVFSIVVSLSGLLILFAVILPLLVTPVMDRLIKSPRSRVPEWVNSHVVICGYSAIVETLIVELARRGIPFVVIDRSPENVLALQRHGREAIAGDATDEDVLAAARIGHAAYLIANAGDDQNADLVLTAAQISDCKIIALVDRLDMAQYLEYAGADFVVSPKQILGANIGSTAVSSISFELSGAVDLGDDVKVCRLPVYPDNPLAGKRLKDLGIRESTGTNVIAVFKNGDFIVNPGPGTVIDEATVLVLVGTGEQIQRAGAIASKAPQCTDGHCIIAGFGDVGKEVARRLDERQIRYTVVDRKPYEVKDQVIGDSADKDALVRAGIDRASTIVVTLNDDARNMLTILLSRNLNPHVNIIARANANSSVSKMYRAGADYVTSLSAVGGQMLARIVESGSLEDTVLLAENVLLAKYAIQGTKLEGRSIEESGMRSRTGCTIVGIREDGQFAANPDPAGVLGPGATIIVVGTASQLEACEQAFGLQKIND
ncbi:MAG TPA: NAD-binding protein [Methanocella sp.]|nr:NAD-binding protein [Methanocella sp.]